MAGSGGAEARAAEGNGGEWGRGGGRDVVECRWRGCECGVGGGPEARLGSEGD